MAAKPLHRRPVEPPERDSLATRRDASESPAEGAAKPPKAPAKTGRRRAAKIVAGALVGVGAVVAAVRTSGYRLPPGVKLVSLSPWQYLVVAAAARRIVDPDSPDAPTADAVDVAGFVDDYVTRMPAGLRADVGGLLGVVEHLAPLRAGHRRRFTNLGPEAQDAALAWLERAGGPFAGAFDGLRALVFMGYYRDARTWPLLGYEGPTLPPQPARATQAPGGGGP
ncbi:MAG: gluconate 2-dehydrogenase subunit 3 family protein [Myxococcales bacterium]|nr:gluconate 2-dehydrogenase subunit 3 family protein [Myxococcales bacterium]